MKRWATTLLLLFGLMIQPVPADEPEEAAGPAAPEAAPEPAPATAEAEKPGPAEI